MHLEKKLFWLGNLCWGIYQLALISLLQYCIFGLAEPEIFLNLWLNYTLHSNLKRIFFKYLKFTLIFISNNPLCISYIYLLFVGTRWGKPIFTNDWQVVRLCHLSYHPFKWFKLMVPFCHIKFEPLEWSRLWYVLHFNRSRYVKYLFSLWVPV